MAIEILDFPSYNMVIFHGYVKLPEGNIFVAFPLMRTMVLQYESHHLSEQHHPAL